MDEDDFEAWLQGAAPDRASAEPVAEALTGAAAQAAEREVGAAAEPVPSSLDELLAHGSGGDDSTVGSPVSPPQRALHDRGTVAAAVEASAPADVDAPGASSSAGPESGDARGSAAAHSSGDERGPSIVIPALHIGSGLAWTRRHRRGVRCLRLALRDKPLAVVGAWHHADAPRGSSLL